MVFNVIEYVWGGEIFVFKILFYCILDVVRVIGLDCEYLEVGICFGEKIYEEMIIEVDFFFIVDFGKYYVIFLLNIIWLKDEYIKVFDVQIVELGFKYNFGINIEWFMVEEI